MIILACRIIPNTCFYHFYAYSAGNQKCRRKDTWERLQRRHADRRMTIKHTEPVWVPAESDQYQTSPDRPVRPNRLPLTSECNLEKMCYKLPSPTAVSLNGGDIPPELTSKSSSAPHLIKSTQTLPRTKYDGLEVFILVD